MTRRDLAVELARMYINENTPDTFTEEEKLAGAVDIFTALDEDIDYYIREVDDRLYRHDIDTERLEESYTAYEWTLIGLLEGLRAYRNALQTRSDVR